MISKQDILDRAAEWQLPADVVEKDYILGWLLAVLSENSETSRSWVFKGGTCLKKCHFETYRFSEDLDFTIRPNGIYTADGLKDVLRVVAQAASAASGIQYSGDTLNVRERQNRFYQKTFEVRLGYRGPLAFPGEPKVRFDLTRHELIVLPAIPRPVFHPYPDTLLATAQIPCYALEELLAEKTRALVERTRPRDLYDVVHIVENHIEELNYPLARDVFGQKCHFKNMTAPSRAELVAKAQADAELKSEWKNMLAHQLPALPAVEVFLERLNECLSWVAEKAVPAPRVLKSAVLADSAIPLVAPRFSRYWGLGIPLEIIRFAGANRLLVKFDYHGKERLVEPYSFRRPGTGNLLLYGWEQESKQTKAFNVVEIQNIRITESPFVPRYRVEFTA